MGWRWRRHEDYGTWLEDHLAEILLSLSPYAWLIPNQCQDSSTGPTPVEVGGAELVGPGVVVGGAAEVARAGVVLGGRVGGGKDVAAWAHQQPNDLGSGVFGVQHAPLCTTGACNSRNRQQQYNDIMLAASIHSDSPGAGVDGAGVVLLGACVVLHGYLFIHRLHAVPASGCSCALHLTAAMARSMPCSV